MHMSANLSSFYQFLFHLSLSTGLSSPQNSMVLLGIHINRFLHHFKGQSHSSMMLPKCIWICLPQLPNRLDNTYKNNPSISVSTSYNASHFVAKYRILQPTLIPYINFSLSFRLFSILIASCLPFSRLSSYTTIICIFISFKGRIYFILKYPSKKAAYT